jgi:hypothetical protein|nr:MAG TPA: hypothetical protein [Caudoviricetes sp.]
MKSAIQFKLETAGLDEREAKVLDFIHAKNKAKDRMDQMSAFENDPEHMRRMTLKAAEDGKSVCIDTVLGQIYKNALPYNDPDKNLSPSDAGAEVRDFIAKRCDNKPTEYYVREALKKNNSSVLRTIVTEAENAAKHAVTIKKNNIGRIDPESIHYDPTANDTAIKNINAKMSLDEISDIIKNNVQTTIDAEKQKVADEDQYRHDIEDTLAQDNKIMDNQTMQDAVNEATNYRFSGRPKVYQPSLFEAIMMNKANKMQGSDPQDIFTEAVHEYTKLAMLKALKLENFDLRNTRDMTYKYITNKA